MNDETDSIWDGATYPVFRVRYAGPTDTRGSRWIASITRDGRRYSVTESYDHSVGGPFSTSPQIVRVARLLREKVAPDAMPIREAIVGDDGDAYRVIFTV